MLTNLSSLYSSTQCFSQWPWWLSKDIQENAVLQIPRSQSMLGFNCYHSHFGKQGWYYLSSWFLPADELQHFEQAKVSMMLSKATPHRQHYNNWAWMWPEHEQLWQDSSSPGRGVAGVPVYVDSRPFWLWPLPESREAVPDPAVPQSYVLGSSGGALLHQAPVTVHLSEQNQEPQLPVIARKSHCVNSGLLRASG